MKTPVLNDENRVFAMKANYSVLLNFMTFLAIWYPGPGSNRYS